MEKVVEKDEIITTEPHEAVTRIYEVALNVVSSVVQDDVAKEFAAIKSLIEKHGGVFISEDMPKLRPLAYAMYKVFGVKKEKFTDAYFGWVKFEMNSDAISGLKKDLDGSQNILRSMIIETVRENTLVQPKVAHVKKTDDEKKEDGVEVSPEVIDESIDKLVTE